jgi:hypothetical protein
MVVLPIGSIVAEHVLQPGAPLITLMGQWFAFWAGGVRLFLAGVMQLLRPAFTAHKIFALSTDEALPLVRELGIANLATGILGIASIAASAFVLPLSIWTTIFYGAASIGHFARRARSANESIAMITDFFAFVVFAAIVAIKLVPTAP